MAEKSGKLKTGKVPKNSIKIINILKEKPEGLRAETIIKLTNLKSRTAYNNLKKLQELGFVLNIYPIWKLCQSQSNHLKLANLIESNTIQGHKFEFILRLINKPDWWEKRENRLTKLKEHQFKVAKEVNWGNNPYEQIINDTFLIHTFKNAIYFINKKTYYEQDSYEAFKLALEDTLEVLRFMEERFKFKFFNDGIPQFSVRSNHFVRLKDSLAEHCKKTGDLMRVEINNEPRAWIDLSQPFGTEFGSKDYAVQDASWYNNFIKDGLIHNPPTNSQLATHIDKLTLISTQDMVKREEYSKDIVEHKKAITILSKSIKQLTKVVGGVLSENQNLKLQLKNQTRLTNFL